MQVKAKITSALPVESGTSKSGNPWSKATLIVETLTQYPKKIALVNFKKAEEFAALPIGSVATFEIEVESREYNGRWYTEASCWNWAIEQPQQGYYPPQGYGQQYPNQYPPQDYYPQQ